MAKYKRHYTHRSSGKSASDEAAVEIESLQSRIAMETPDRGYAPPLDQQVSFRALPLSEATLAGLDECNFVTMTEIQNACIPHALADRDVLGAARTGSGKTLAFLIPLLEKLFCSRVESLGAIVLSPTRELAMQTFGVLRKVGAYHNLSAGLIVGGKKEFHLEQRHVASTHILIATPGRLLQHLEQTPNLDTSDLQMLVLDEADRILDMGFREQMVCILEYLPTTRQTLLFSATQTRRVSDLATLSLRKPEYLGIHDKATTSTPTKLIQSIVVVPLQHKLNMVYSFVKSHLKHRTIIFLASCSQVRFVWQLFCSLQPGIPVMALHGKLAQDKRSRIYHDFLQNRKYAVLFATDVAARGLDFTNVDWVVQMDAPEDKDMYIHRVGRTARYDKGGKSLLCVTPQEEEKMVTMLKQARVPLKKSAINPSKTVLVTQRAASLVASDQKLHSLAKKAFKSYVRSIHLMPDKEMFSVADLPLDDFASSLGLASTPNVRFLTKAKDREQLRKSKNVNHKLHKLKEQIKAEKLAKKIEKMGGAKDSGKKKKRKPEDSDEDEDDLLVVKKRHDWGTNEEEQKEEDLPDVHLHEVTKSRHSNKRIRIDGSNVDNKRIVFNDDGQEEDPTRLLVDQDVQQITANSKETLVAASENYVQLVRDRLETNLQQDRAEEKERIRQVHRKRRMKFKGEKDGDGEEPEMVVTLGGSNDVATTGQEIHQGLDDSASEASSSDDEESDNDVDVKAQEDLALAMIRNNF